jgi:hypothetical protein
MQMISFVGSTRDTRRQVNGNFRRTNTINLFPANGGAISGTMLLEKIRELTMHILQKTLQQSKI